MPRPSRTLFLYLHLWLGLATGLVLAVVCATGAVLVFERELEEAMHPARYHVQAQGPRLPLDTVVARVNAALPEGQVTGVTVHAAPARALDLRLGGPDGAPSRGTADPYTGALLSRYSPEGSVFSIAEDLHRRLLGEDIGKLIVGTSTLLFLVILVSGVVLWWPRSRRQLRARLTVRARSGWKRLAHDLHVSLGIYTAVFLFVMAFTGLAWSFTWFNDGIYTVTRSAKHDSTPPEVAPGPARVPLQAGFETARGLLGNAPSYSIALPKDSVSVLTVRAVPLSAPHDRATDVVHLDPYTGQVAKLDRYADRSLGARTRSAFYPFHVGSIGGTPLRVLYFLACVLGATFPITGALIWVNKRLGGWRRRWRRPPVAVAVPVEA